MRTGAVKPRRNRLGTADCADLYAVCVALFTIAARLSLWRGKGQGVYARGGSGIYFPDRRRHDADRKRTGGFCGCDDGRCRTADRRPFDRFIFAERKDLQKKAAIKRAKRFKGGRRKKLLASLSFFVRMRSLSDFHKKSVR